MARTSRLFELLQALREHRYPVSGEVLAQRLNISLRTLYRDIAELKAQGAAIDGEAGVGYVLQPGFLLPPLMFSEQEIEALALGTSWVAKHVDPEMAAAGQAALAKIAAVLPHDFRSAWRDAGLMVVGGKDEEQLLVKKHLPLIRQAIRNERKLDLDYLDLKGMRSRRIVWPVALGFFERHRLLVAWCEMRGDFRSFRVDRMEDLTALELPYPKRRRVLLNEWRDRQGIKPDK